MLTATILMGGGIITSQPLEASASTAVQQKTTYSTTANLNLRAGTSTKHKILTTIPKGKAVHYISKHGSWYKVKYGSKTGYVASSYIKSKKETSSPTIVSPKAPASSGTTKSYSTTANLNLRTQASTKGKVLTTIPKGKNVSYISAHGSWYKVKYGSKTGYVSSKYVTSKNVSAPSKVTAPKAPASSSVSKKYSTTANLNLRSQASTKGKVLTTIPKGKSVSYVSKHGSWLKVKYGSKTGYVSSKYIKITDVKAPSKPAPKPVVKPAPTVKPKPTPATPPAGGQQVLGQYFTIDSLNMRSGGGIEHGIVTTIPKGGKVDHLATSGNWYQVKYGSKTGWVNASYLSKTQLTVSEPDAGVKWLASEGVKRTDALVAQMKRTSLQDPFLMPVQGRLTSPYGIRSNPTGEGFEFHTGVDYANTTGTPILAAADAMVDRVVSGTTGYGRYVVLRHDMKGLTFYSLYAHLHTIDVKPGQIVKRGEKIGGLGSTGRSTGPHLHFEIQNGSRQNVNAQTLLDY